LDTGAAKSVIGLAQAHAYCREYRIPFEPTTSTSRFIFGDQECASLGKLNILVPCPDMDLKICVDIVHPSVPLLFGIDILDKHKLNVLSVENKLHSVLAGWTLPLVRQQGHLYLKWHPPSETFYSRQQLYRLHQHLFHPSADKLLNLLKRANPENLPADTKAVLKDISKSCHACQVYSSKPIHFQIRDPAAIVFNHEIQLDLMYLHGKPVLHIVDVATTFSAANFLPAQDVSSVWNTFLTGWATLYIGFPECILADQGSVFMATHWKTACELSNIHLRHTGTESHNSLGSGERFHSPLRRIYEKISLEFPTIPEHVRLALSVKAMNDICGPEGLVPSLLVFGVLPRLSGITSALPHQSERMKALQMARKEYEMFVCQRRVQTGLRKQPPPAANYIIRPGDRVYVYREQLSHWTGPHVVTSVDGKDIAIDLGERTGPRHFNCAQVKPAFISPDPHDLSTENLSKTAPILFTEVIKSGDPRAAMFDQAKRDEIMGLIERGTFKLIQRKDAGPHPTIVPGRFVLAIKTADGSASGNSGSEILKARFVLGGHRDRDKFKLVHNSTTLKQSSIRIITALASILGFRMWSTDIKQAYLQSAEDLKREIYVRPDVMKLPPDELLQVVKPLYGLADSGDYWHETLTAHHTTKLLMEQSTGDFSFFFRKKDKELYGMSGTHVDDIFQAGKDCFRRSVLKCTADVFDSKPPEEDKFVFTGLEIDASSTDRTISQDGYIKRLKFLSNGCTFSDFRSMRARLSWTTHTRPDIACSVSMAAQATDITFEENHVKALNDVIKFLKATPNIFLRYSPLDRRTLRMVVYSDASLNNLVDNRSQLGYVILLSDASNRCSLLHYSSHKSTRVTRSSMAAETLAFSNAFDNAFIIKHDIERMIGPVHLLMLTDSKALFDVLTRTRYTTERRLMVDIAAAREAYHEQIISNIGLIRSEFNIADGLTKAGPNEALSKFLVTHCLDHPIEQYVTNGEIPS
jgi:hypothetical protein